MTHGMPRHMKQRSTPQHDPANAAGATLIVTVVLVAVSTLLALYLSRGLVFEQRASATQVRATIALATAEAGLDWAIAMLNHPPGINDQCQAEAGQPPFRQRYAPDAPNTTGAPTASPACHTDDNGLRCACPATGEASLGGTAEAGFSARVAAEPLATGEAWRVSALGCAVPSGACTPGRTALADAHALASVAVARQPLLRVAPLATLTCGGRCELAGTTTLTNRSAAAQGLLVQAGAAISVGSGVSLQSLAGTPGASALVANDTTLAQGRAPDPDCGQGALFEAYFGAPLSAYARAPTVLALDCSQAGDCAQHLMQAFERGWRAFHLSGGWSAASGAGPLQLGTATDPVLLVASGPVQLPEASVIHGLIYVGHPGPDALRASSAELNGAVVACGHLRLDGNSHLSHDAAVLDATRRAGSLLVKVPGSWRDFE